MAICGAFGCGSRTASLKCARCQVVFYCNAACQLADWQHHKPSCKRLPSSAAASGSTSKPPRQLLRAQNSTSTVDIQLLHFVRSFLSRVSAAPSSLQVELPPVLLLTKALLARGARPDVLIRAFGTSCIADVIVVGCQGMEPLVELLLDAPCKPAPDANAACVSEAGSLHTPVHYAAISYRHSLLRLLVAHGADLKAPCGQGEHGVLHWPVRACAMAISEDVAANDAVDGALQTLEYLVSAGADVNAVDDRWIGDRPPQQSALRYTLLSADRHTAGRALLEAVAMKLIDAGANVNERDDCQVRPLDCAACLPSLDVFKALIAKGADPTPTPCVALEARLDRAACGTHYVEEAIHQGRTDVLQAAAAAGVKLKKVKAMRPSALPLLTYAAGRGQLACVRFLLDYGCDVVQQVYELGTERVTAFDVATQRLSQAKDDPVLLQIVTALLYAGGSCAAEL